MGKYICQRPIHPGELLKEETEERKLSQRKLAEQMGISYKPCYSKLRWESVPRC